MTNTEIFKERNYLDLKNVIPIDVCRVVSKYALMKEEVKFRPELGETAQVRNAHSVYGDTLMETMLYFLHPHLEKNTGLSLCPTYSYYRVYRSGMVLERHRDRPSCEISATVCFGYHYSNQDKNYRWGMYIDNNKEDKLIVQNPGDVIVYRGCDVDHWRTAFEGNSKSYQVQAFLHYVDKNGPFYPEYAYDKRLGIGYLEKNV